MEEDEITQSKPMTLERGEQDRARLKWLAINNQDTQGKASKERA